MYLDKRQSLQDLLCIFVMLYIFGMLTFPPPNQNPTELSTKTLNNMSTVPILDRE